MPLKKISFEKNIKIVLDNLLEKLLKIEFVIDQFNYLNEIAFLPSKNFDDNIKIHYGWINDKNNLDLKLVKILFCLSILEIFINENDSSWAVRPSATKLLNNSLVQIKACLVDYKIVKKNWIYNFETNKFKTVTENLKDIPQKIANPIIELLKPMKNEMELVGLICQVYKEFEKITPKDLKNLNQTDNDLYKNVWNLAKQLANKVDGAKGHKGESQLTIKDIAHNFALNASLIQKFIQINQPQNNLFDEKTMFDDTSIKNAEEKYSND